jgi:ADP-L-glycero-D-manno-heptose 6-epimerase
VIIVTGGAGFIGSNLVHALNAGGRDDIVIVDDLTDGKKFTNISNAQIADYLDIEEFRRAFTAGRFPFDVVDRVYHLGACSATTEWNGRLMLDVNFAYSRDLLNCCANHAIPFIYASSAAVYGVSTEFSEIAENEQPLNVYAYSKILFDRYVRRKIPELGTQVVGLRYFNVYGPREQHKGSMASVAFHLNRQLLDSGRIRLFEGSHGRANGEQRRDFIHVDDAVRTTLWFENTPACSGIFNCGTGQAQTFNELAQAVLAWHGRGTIEYIPFPGELASAYQSFTVADLDKLRDAGCDIDFIPLNTGVSRYLDWLNA